MKRLVIGIALVVAVSGVASRAEAQWAVNDAPAITQRAIQFVQYLIQLNQMVNTAQDNLAAFKRVYDGLRDWRNLGWSDLLQIVDLPWFDGIEGIDDLRRATYLTVMSVTQAEQLWENVNYLDHWRLNPRYRTDPWFKAKVDSLLRQSKRARATRAALLRQMQMQNKSVNDDVLKIKRLRNAIEAENRNQPVNQGKITSLQAEIAATEAKYKGQELMLRNQQAIMFLVGQDEAERSYLEQRDRGWMRSNSQAMRRLGAAMAR